MYSLKIFDGMCSHIVSNLFYKSKFCFCFLFIGKNVDSLKNSYDKHFFIIRLERKSVC